MPSTEKVDGGATMPDVVANSQSSSPLAASNVALVNPATQKADRIGVRTLKDGRKARFFKSNGELVDA